jgi:hypothetical protein
MLYLNNTGQPHLILASICESNSNNSRETEASSSLLMSISFFVIKSSKLLPLAIVAWKHICGQYASA